MTVTARKIGGRIDAAIVIVIVALGVTFLAVPGVAIAVIVAALILTVDALRHRLPRRGGR